MSEEERSPPVEAHEEEHEENAEDVEAENASGDEKEFEAPLNAPEVDPIFDQMLMKPVFERREKSLKELVDAMDEFSPIIPDAVTDYYLTKAGFKTSDVRIKRLLALATQKFVADIANDAYQFSRIHAQSSSTQASAPKRQGGASGSNRTVLTMESLGGVLDDYGIDARRPDFFR